MKPQPRLDHLSREEKLELLTLLDEKQRRALLAKPKFIPHEGQHRVITSPAQERYLFCGNAFGKSTVLVNEVHWAATGYNPVTGQKTALPAKVCLVLDTPEKVEDFITEYRKWNHLDDKHVHKKGKPYPSFFTYDTGSTVTVLTHEVSDLKPEGSQWTHVFLDEPPPKWLFLALFRGMRIKGRPAKVLLAGTPVKAAWLRTDVYDPWVEGRLPYVECFTGLSEENAANLEDGWLERFSAKLDDKERGIRLAGQFFDLEGLALAHLFKPSTHIIPSENFEWNRQNPCVVVIDPAPAKAHVAVLMGVDDCEQLYVLDEFKEKADARRFSERLVEQGWFHAHRVVNILYDSLGNSENLMGEGYKPFGTILNEVLRENGIGHARATTYDEKSDEDFIERVREALIIPKDGAAPKLRFLDKCKGAINDVRTVQWYEDKTIRENKPKLDIRKKDYLACIKYALATNLFFDKPRRSRPHYVSTAAYGFDLRPKKRIRVFGKPAKDDDDDDDF